MEIYRNRKAGKLWLTQRFNMLNAKPVKTPVAAHFRLSTKFCPKTENEVEYMA